ncbi:ATP-binding protein [Paenibacillus alba]|uniref:ATP-binding protein n=1 Tax=Paenibacillus alba TaxID=1197127 RepID=A0ABU6G7L7_9BACL|nr:ATP-binding protein [Paenibacillus alba]MEC0228744.1 ATP-binding protein [Paenibacillus alba]
MSKMKIKRIHYNENIDIKLNDGDNYILGANGVGKTTLFNLIQYLLGVRKTMIRSLSLDNNITKPFLECQFDTKFVKISREMNSNEINFEGGIDARVKVGTKELNEIYSGLMGIEFTSNINEKSSLDILKLSFLSEVDLGRNYVNKVDSYYKILGFNAEYLNSIEDDINKLKKELELQSNSLAILERYKSNSINSLREKEFLSNVLTDVTDVLEEEYQNNKDYLLNNYHLLQSAEKVYKYELMENQKNVDYKIAELESYFQKSLSLVNSRLINFSLKDAIKEKNARMFSFTERVTVLFILHLTLCRNIKSSEIHNGSGLLIADNLFSIKDNNSKKSIREVIKELTITDDFQYIEFCSDLSSVPKESVVYNMSPRLGGGLFV